MANFTLSVESGEIRQEDLTANPALNKMNDAADATCGIARQLFAMWK